MAAPLRCEPVDGQQDAMQQRFRAWRASRDVDVHGNYLIHSAEGRVIDAEDTAADAAGADSNDDLRLRSGIVGFPQSQLHVARNGAGDEQHVGMARRSHEMDTKALDVVHGIVEGIDLQFASVAGAGIDLADGEGSAEDIVDPGSEGVSDRLLTRAARYRLLARYRIACNNKVTAAPAGHFKL